jgi:hypothetical protein
MLSLKLLDNAAPRVETGAKNAAIRDAIRTKLKTCPQLLQGVVLNTPIRNNKATVSPPLKVLTENDFCHSFNPCTLAEIRGAKGRV